MMMLTGIGDDVVDRRMSVVAVLLRCQVDGYCLGAYPLLVVDMIAVDHLDRG